MNGWNGYPQRPDAHPERPWWRKMVTSWNYRIKTAHERHPDPGSWSWLRDDGATLPNHESIEDYDNEHPLPAPNPMCGQVWVCFSVTPPLIVEDMVLSVERMGGASLVRWGTGVSSTGACDPEGGTWPPSSAVLVAGPGSPWAPMGGGG